MFIASALKSVETTLVSPPWSDGRNIGLTRGLKVIRVNAAPRQRRATWEGSEVAREGGRYFEYAEVGNYPVVLPTKPRVNK